MWADVSAVHATSIFRFEMSRVGEFVYICMFLVHRNQVGRETEHMVMGPAGPPEPWMTVLARASSKLPETETNSPVS
jgi:hypothetical protein